MKSRKFKKTYTFSIYKISALLLREILKSADMQKVFKHALIITLFFISCQSSTIIPQKDMIPILVKMQLIDASLQNSGLRHADKSKDTIDYYVRTIESYGYTQAQFDTSIAFYTKTPKDLDAIYDMVIIELSKIEMKIIEVNKIHTDSIIKDTIINLWNLKHSFEFPADSTLEHGDFKIPTEGLGVYTISADVFVKADDKSTNPSMVAYFYFDDKSKEGMKSVITSKSYKKSQGIENYSVQLELRNTLVTHLKGSIFSYDNSSKNITKHLSITNIEVRYKPFNIKKSKFSRRNRIALPKE